MAKDPKFPEKLRKAGFSETEITATIKKMEDGYVPTGYQVHHKYPLDDGGTNDFSNLVLIKNEPYHKAITAFHNKYLKSLAPGTSLDVELPMPKGSFYSPPYFE